MAFRLAGSLSVNRPTAPSLVCFTPAMFSLPRGCLDRPHCGIVGAPTPTRRDQTCAPGMPMSRRPHCSRGLTTVSIHQAAQTTKTGGRRLELRTHHVRSRRSLHDRHAQPPRKAQCLYRADGGGDRGCVRARRYRRQCPRRHRDRRGSRVLRGRRRLGWRRELRYVRNPRRRRVCQFGLAQRPFRRGDLQLPKTLDRRHQRAGRRRRHHHDPADGRSHCGQGRQDRLHLRPPRPGPGSRQRLVPAETRRPAAGVALVPVGSDFRCR